MWTEGLYSCMATIGRPQSRFATFTAAGSVRRGLTAAGFAVRKVPGHGNKREMLVGELKNPSPRQAPAETPWHLPGDAYPDAGSGNLRRGRAVATRALVLGAGLAGASVASALARRGWQVAVYERATIAAGASGNRQGALYTRLSHRRSALTEFSLHSFIHAVRCYRAMFEDGALEQGVDGELCGAIQLTPDWDEDNPLLPTLRSLPELVIHLEAAEAAGITGLPACPAGLYYPDSGWLNPPAVCRALLNTGDIAVRENCGEMTLQRHGDGWLLVDERGAPVDEAPVAVVACGNASENLLDADWLRLQSIRGQTTLLPSTGPLRQLNTVICHEGYIAPARGGVHSVGATFDIDDPEPELRTGDHRANLDQLGRALPCLAQAVDIETRHLGGRTGFRCASPDYLPVVGPVPSMADFCRDYAALRRNAKRTLAHPGSYRNGLYVSTGHGSRGLTSTPLTAELLAAQIAGEPWPVSVPLGRALSPARFLVRGLGRGLL